MTTLAPSKSTRRRAVARPPSSPPSPSTSGCGRPGQPPPTPMCSPPASRQRDSAVALSDIASMNVGACLRHHARHERADDCGDHRALADARPWAGPSPDAGTRPRTAGRPRAGLRRHRIAANTNPVLRGANDTTAVSPRPSRPTAERANAPASATRRRDSAVGLADTIVQESGRGHPRQAGQERVNDCGDRRAPADARPRAGPSPGAGTRPRAAGQPRAGLRRHWMPRTRTRSCTAPTTGPASRRARQRQAPAAPVARRDPRPGAPTRSRSRLRRRNRSKPGASRVPDGRLPVTKLRENRGLRDACVIFCT